MGLADAREALNADVDAGKFDGPPQDTSAIEQETSASSEVTQEPNIKLDSNNNDQKTVEKSVAETIDEIFDIDKVANKKFRFQGQEWSKEDLKNAFLRREDYTKKSMAIAEEKKQIEEVVKYARNFPADLSKVIENKELVSEFRKIYPQGYHHLLDKVLSGTITQSQAVAQAPRPHNGQADGQAQAQASTIDPALLKRLEILEMNDKSRADQIFQSEVKAASAEIDAIFDKLTQKYPMADQMNCIAAGQHFLDNNKVEKRDPYTGEITYEAPTKIPEATWDKIFKHVHDMHMDRYKSHYSKQVKEQKQANQQAKDAPQGGGLVDRPKEKLRLRDVASRIESDIAAGRV